MEWRKVVNKDLARTAFVVYHDESIGDWATQNPRLFINVAFSWSSLVKLHDRDRLAIKWQL